MSFNLFNLFNLFNQRTPMKRLARLLPLLVLAAGCARSSLPSEMPVPEPPPYRTVQLDAEPGPAEGGGSGGLSCRIVKIFPNDSATFRFENRTDAPVFVDLESVVAFSRFFGFYAPGLLFLRAYDDEGRVCSTNAPGASPDGFWSPGMESDRIPSDKEIAKRETAVPPGEGIVCDIHIPEFFGSAAPSTRMAAVEPAASVRLPSGERRTIVGPRISYSPSERGEIRSWTDWFRKQTGLEASGMVLSSYAVPSKQLSNDPDFRPILVFLAPTAAGVEKGEIDRSCWIVDPGSPQAERIVAAMRRHRSLSRLKIQPLANHVALLVWDPSGDGWSSDSWYPDGAMRAFLREIRGILESATNAPAEPAPFHAEAAESESLAETAESAESAETATRGAVGNPL